MVYTLIQQDVLTIELHGIDGTFSEIFYMDWNWMIKDYTLFCVSFG